MAVVRETGFDLPASKKITVPMEAQLSAIEILSAVFIVNFYREGHLNFKQMRCANTSVPGGTPDNSRAFLTQETGVDKGPRRLEQLNRFTCVQWHHWGQSVGSPYHREG